MRCKTCGEYIYKGKKFNARKETVQNEDYLGIKVFRFYIKCPRCLAEVTFKTDPQNSDYIVEHGATRNFQALKLAEEAAEREAREEEEDEKNNPMKLLEKRTQASKQEMDLIEALEDLKDLNKRQANVNFDAMLGRYAAEREAMLKRQEEEDENLIASVFGKSAEGAVKRIVEDSDEDSEEDKPKRPRTTYEKPTDILAEGTSVSNTHAAGPTLMSTSKAPVAPKSSSKSLLAGLVRPKSTLSTSEPQKLAGSGASSSQSATSNPVASSGLNLLGTYSGSDESD